jgi:hypothetical protein
MESISFFRIATILFVTVLVTHGAWKSQFVYYGSDGKLIYKEDEKGNKIPDFGRVGYKKGKTPPNIDVKITLTPVTGDNLPQIKTAIDSVGRMPLDADGFRGAVLLKRGRYEVVGTISINKSGVVLRGEGANRDSGTVLYYSKPENHTAIILSGGSNYKEVDNSRVKITDSYVPVGTKTISVESVSGFSVGDNVAVFRPATENWIHDLKMDSLPPRPDGNTVTQWSTDKYSTTFEREIKAIEGNRLTFEQPIVMNIEDNYGGGFIYKYTDTKRIRNSGVEDLFLTSYFDSSKTKVYNSGETFYSDQNHANTGVKVNYITDGWVRNITTEFFGYSTVAVNSKGKYISILNCTGIKPVSVTSGGQRYAFNVNGQMCLFSGCYADRFRHTYVAGPRVPGPNVVHRSRATNELADIGPHQRWAMGQLYDVLEVTGTINVQDRQNSGSGHGWTGSNFVIWNCDAAAYIVKSPWVTGKNYLIGSRGKINTKGMNPSANQGEIEGIGETDLEIESLYEAQVKDKDFIVATISSSSNIISPIATLTANNRVLKIHSTASLNNATIKIYAISGRVIKEISLNGNKEVSLKRLNSGIYIVRLIDKDLIVTSKILIN